MFGGKKGHDLFHNLFSRLYWTATFSQPKTDKINIFTRHLANTKKDICPRNTTILLESNSQTNQTKSLFNTKIPLQKKSVQHMKIPSKFEFDI